MINFYKNKITFPLEENAFKVRIRIDGWYAGTAQFWRAGRSSVLVAVV